MKSQIKNKKSRRKVCGWIFMEGKLFWAKNVWGVYSKWEDYWSDHANVRRSFMKGFISPKS